MTQRCKACSHPERAAIDAALVTGTGTVRDIAGQHGLSPSSLDRHRQAHIPAALAQATQAAEVVQADDLLGQVRSLLADARRIQQAAEAARDLKTALAGVREQARVLELLAKLLGELESSTTVNVLNVTASPEWALIRSALTKALAPYPEATQAVARALSAGGQP